MAPAVYLDALNILPTAVDFLSTILQEIGLNFVLLLGKLDNRKEKRGKKKKRERKRGVEWMGKERRQDMERRQRKERR